MITNNAKPPPTKTRTGDSGNSNSTANNPLKNINSKF